MCVYLSAACRRVGVRGSPRDGRTASQDELDAGASAPRAVRHGMPRRWRGRPAERMIGNTYIVRRGGSMDRDGGSGAGEQGACHQQGECQRPMARAVPRSRGRAKGGRWGSRGARRARWAPKQMAATGGRRYAPVGTRGAGVATAGRQPDFRQEEGTRTTEGRRIVAAATAWAAIIEGEVHGRPRSRPGRVSGQAGPLARRAGGAPLHRRLGWGD